MQQSPVGACSKAKTAIGYRSKFWNWQGYPHRAGAAGAGVWGNHVTGPEKAEDAVAKPVSCPINNLAFAVAGWRFFRVARSSRINSDMLVVRALKNPQLAMALGLP